MEVLLALLVKVNLLLSTTLVSSVESITAPSAVKLISALLAIQVSQPPMEHAPLATSPAARPATPPTCAQHASLTSLSTPLKTSASDAILQDALSVQTPISA